MREAKELLSCFPFWAPPISSVCEPRFFAETSLENGAWANRGIQKYALVTVCFLWSYRSITGLCCVNSDPSRGFLRDSDRSKPTFRFIFWAPIRRCGTGPGLVGRNVVRLKGLALMGGRSEGGFDGLLLLIKNRGISGKSGPRGSL